MYWLKIWKNVLVSEHEKVWYIFRTLIRSWSDSRRVLSMPARTIKPSAKSQKLPSIYFGLFFTSYLQLFAMASWVWWVTQQRFPARWPHSTRTMLHISYSGTRTFLERPFTGNDFIRTTNIMSFSDALFIRECLERTYVQSLILNILGSIIYLWLLYNFLLLCITNSPICHIVGIGNMYIAASYSSLMVKIIDCLAR